MREPDAWWGHIPVFIETLWKVRDHEYWYRRRLRCALANIKAPTDLERIPDDGFYVRIVAGSETTIGTHLRLHLGRRTRWILPLCVTSTDVHRLAGDLPSDD